MLAQKKGCREKPIELNGNLWHQQWEWVMGRAISRVVSVLVYHKPDLGKMLASYLD